MRRTLDYCKDLGYDEASKINIMKQSHTDAKRVNLWRAINVTYRQDIGDPYHMCLGSPVRRQPCCSMFNEYMTSLGEGHSCIGLLQVTWIERSLKDQNYEQSHTDTKNNNI